MPSRVGWIVLKEFTLLRCYRFLYLLPENPVGFSLLLGVKSQPIFLLAGLGLQTVNDLSHILTKVQCIIFSPTSTSTPEYRCRLDCCWIGPISHPVKKPMTGTSPRYCLM